MTKRITARQRFDQILERKTKEWEAAIISRYHEGFRDGQEDIRRSIRDALDVFSTEAIRDRDREET